MGGLLLSLSSHGRGTHNIRAHVLHNMSMNVLSTPAWACRLHVSRVSRATPSSYDGGCIFQVTSRIAVRRPPRVHAPPERHRRRETNCWPRGQGMRARLVAFLTPVCEGTRAASMRQEARRCRSPRKALSMASTTPAASVRGQSTYAPKERSFERFGVILSG